MSVPLQPNLAAPGTRMRVAPQRVAVVRALFALLWAAALVIAVGGHMPSTDADLSIGVAAFLASYPLIDVVASLIGSASDAASARVQRVNAGISALAVLAIGITAFASTAGATLVAFGLWAAVSGAIQLALAIHRRRTGGRQLPMIVSGGLSTIAGISFIAASGMDEAKLTTVGGYMALGALLYLLWARRVEPAPQTAR
jgi:uncharacterized membrane protein HdeD (DUF308 family)